MEGKQFAIEVEDSDTVERVKQKIKDKEGIPIEDQQISYYGAKLEDGHKVKEYDIQKDTDLFLVNEPHNNTEIFVKTLTGKTITLKVGEDDTILSVKQKIQDKEGIPPDQQRLLFYDLELKDDSTVLENLIIDQAELKLILKPVAL
ncbi:MAG: putative Polyubiquitin [Streblomastix strix]|uniref:Putative Polyubiquitin n=1 Tax=Streblomastix strix TaxID=222440 RepID=A0A5J4XAF3_9EUKA|nr:MAG: putative Polyubiquitin [Streblomastix strix]